MRTKHITARIGVASLLIVFSSFASEIALAKTNTTRKWNSTLQEATLSTANGYPAPGGTASLAGVVTAPGFGRGADLDHSTITGHPSATVFTFKGQEVDFFKQGTERSTYDGTATVQADGSQLIVDTARFTGGTGRYRGARGRYKFTGTVPPGSTVVTGHSTGSITY